MMIYEFPLPALPLLRPDNALACFICVCWGVAGWLWWRMVRG